MYQHPEKFNSLRTRLRNTFSRDTGEFSVVTRSKDEDVFIDTSSPKRHRDNQNWPYPFGLQIFSHPASFLLVAVATTTAFSSCLAGLRKSLATRLEDISETGSMGFTLIEALVALVVLTMALGPALVLSSNISSTASVIRNNLIAANLSQEGVEVVRALRDANWYNGLAFDSGLADGTYRIEWNSDALIALGGNPALKLNAGLYNYSSGTDTIFYRTISITKLNSEELKIISSITWTERANSPRGVTTESHLFNWK